ncbi:hypothetical protein [Rhodopirellula sp. P2]|uniref:hypothetical protein n=1 Tax=Rhodopirellula sp. P2 TaxID=2127060 RepID=UPI00236801A8|nr:hypothetical protein [Rhodopirellula sp. P2]WDQ14572.1 hypothetical protein PSR62_13045 [Rhodopirellula sp. P2]
MSTQPISQLNLLVGFDVIAPLGLMHRQRFQRLASTLLSHLTRINDRLFEFPSQFA